VLDPVEREWERRPSPMEGPGKTVHLERREKRGDT
jgi:hypothetical protein